MIQIQWILCFIYTVLLINKVRSQCVSTQSLSASYASSIIQSPGYNTGYSQNLACMWSITTSLSGASIIYQIRDIWISCSGDKVVTYDGTSDSATVIDDLCSSSGGGARGNIRVPPSGNVFIKFTTNNNIDAAIEKGFQFFYTAAKDFSGSGCSGTQSLTASSTDSYISSPSFPSKYPLSTTCNWAITAADNSEKVYIEIIFIDVENDATCQYDYLRIRDGTIDTKICLTDWNYGTTYTSTGTNFDLTFYSDNAQDAQGFLLKYRQTQSLQSETRVNIAHVASNGSTSTVITTALPSSTTVNIETTGHGTSPGLTDATTTNAASTTLQMPATTTSTITSAIELNTSGSSATTTTSSVAVETTSQTQLAAASTVSCDGTTCVLPAVLGSVIGTGVLSVAGLFIVMKSKGMIGKYSPGQNKVNVERGEYGDKKDKNEVDKNENVEDNNPDEPPPYITEKTAIDIVIDQPLENG